MWALESRSKPLKNGSWDLTHWAGMLAYVEWMIPVVHSSGAFCHPRWGGRIFLHMSWERNLGHQCDFKWLFALCHSFWDLDPFSFSLLFSLELLQTHKFSHLLKIQILFRSQICTQDRVAGECGTLAFQILRNHTVSQQAALVSTPTKSMGRGSLPHHTLHTHALFF